jgi:hypothetical protein
MFLVDVDNLLHLVVATQEDTTPIVDVLRDDVEHTRHLAVDCLPARCKDWSEICNPQVPLFGKESRQGREEEEEKE